MALCTSGILMAAITSGLIITDLSYHRSDRVVTHLCFGGFITLLFFVLCQRGYEMVNWGFLLIIPISILLHWLFSMRHYEEPSESDYDEPCRACGRPAKSCGCRRVEPDEVSPCKRIHKPKSCGCPANPITLSTECGISRYT